MRRRGSGILLHVTSLPGGYGLGDLGPEAYAFVDFLAQARQSVWQVLPLGPTSPALGNSPYSGFSAFAGHPALISPERMVADGLLEHADLDQLPRVENTDRADYESAERIKLAALRTAFERSGQALETRRGFRWFLYEHRLWLYDYALFTAIKEHHGGRIWTEWPRPLRERHPEALAAFEAEHREELRFYRFVQYVFFSQWSALRIYANERHVHLVGDAPIYVSLDSADVWAHPDLFKLDKDLRPVVVAGVPPDYFSKTGQLWGNPVYDWSRHEETGFKWWLDRIGHNFRLYDQVRIDHFRGFAGYWEVPAGEKTAVNGKWVDAPGETFFDTLCSRFSSLPIIAEDLGLITPDVHLLRDTFDFPGMKILQFSFGDDVASSTNALHNHIRNCLVYTGTHDNNTTRGWFENEADDGVKQRMAAYLGGEAGPDRVAWELIRLAMSSVARLAVFPMQDVLGLGASARMNTPAEPSGNWTWRVAGSELTPELARRLARLTTLFGRADSSLDPLALDA